MQGQTNLKRVENLIRKHFRCESNERIPNMLTRLNPQDLFQIWSFRFYCWWIKFGSPVEILVNVRLIHALHPVKFNSSPPKKGPDYEENIVFQSLFFKGELLNFGGVTISTGLDGICPSTVCSFWNSHTHNHTTWVQVVQNVREASWAVCIQRWVE